MSLLQIESKESMWDRKLIPIVLKYLFTPEKSRTIQLSYKLDSTKTAEARSIDLSNVIILNTPCKQFRI